MANPYFGEVAAEFKGEEITLKLTSNSIAILEEETGRPVGEIIDGFQKLSVSQKGFRFTDVRLIFWAAMLDDLPKATVKDAGVVIDNIDGGWPKNFRILIGSLFGNRPAKKGK